MRFNLATLEKRIERFERRARLLNVPPLVVTCTGEWDESDRLAYAEADEAERAAIEARYLGRLGEHPDPLAVMAVVVNVPLGWELDEPNELDEPIHDESEEKQRAIVERLQNDLRNAADAVPLIDLGPDERDSNPDGDPNEVLYVDERSGFPVRRAEHQLRRQHLIERLTREAQERRRIEHARISGGTYVSWDKRKG